MTTINSGDSQNVSGRQSLEAPLNVAGELNVSGELNIDTKPGISGIVTDSSNTPIENATVNLFLQDNGTASKETITDVNGAYSFSEHPDATNTLQMWHVVASYDDGTDKFFSRSKFGVKASLVPGVISATGGTTVTTFTDSSGQEYQIHAFENVGTDTFEVANAPVDSTVDVLVVGGGGSGGNGKDGDDDGGGGGAGGLVYRTSYPLNVQNYTIQVGDGGADSNGQNSTFNNLTALGGGQGGGARGQGRDGADGGSGGGGQENNAFPGGLGLQPNQSGESGTFGFGNDGATGGGGGGAGSEGFGPSEDGGEGLNLSDDFGTAFGDSGFFASGGAGQGGTASVGGGQDGQGESDTSKPPAAMQNTGGGGGGANDDANQDGGDGGSGIVIIRYEI